MFFCDNLFYKRHLNSEQKKRKKKNKNSVTFSEGHWTNKRLKLFKLKFLHGFPLRKTQRSEKAELYLDLLFSCVWLQPMVALQYLPDWLWQFLLPPVCTVQYSLLMWCLQQNVQASTVDGDWNKEKEGWNHKAPSSFQSLWIISEIKCFYLFQVNCIVSWMNVSFRWPLRFSVSLLYDLLYSHGLNVSYNEETQHNRKDCPLVLACFSRNSSSGEWEQTKPDHLSEMQ